MWWYYFLQAVFLDFILQSIILEQNHMPIRKMILPYLPRAVSFNEITAMHPFVRRFSLF